MESLQAFSSLLVANCVVVLAVMVQTSTGMGFGMIAAPLLALISLEYVPGPILFINLFLSLIMLGDGRADIVQREIGLLLLTILLGIMAGAAIILRFCRKVFKTWAFLVSCVSRRPFSCGDAQHGVLCSAGPRRGRGGGVVGEAWCGVCRG